MNFFNVCQIFYLTGIFPKAWEYPEKIKLDKQHNDISNFKLNLNNDISDLPVYTTKKDLTRSEQESIANKYGFSTGYFNHTSNKFVTYDDEQSDNNFVTF